MSHTDPFCLQNEICSGCSQPLKDSRIPCLSCFGDAAYCGDDCMARFYPAHNFECSKSFRRKIQNNFLRHRASQLEPRKGFPALLEHLMKSVNAEELRQSIFIIRQPLEAQAKFSLAHPIKKVSRTAWRALAQKSLLFDAVWRSFIRLAAENSERVFVIVYAPDLSFAKLLAVGTPPVMQHILCPCAVHGASTTA